MRVLLRLVGVLLAISAAVVVAAWIGGRISDVRDARALERLSQDGSRQPRNIEATGPMPRELVESSGVVVSRRHEGVLWSHNDSGDDPVVYAIDFQGQLLGTYEIRQAEAFDWEDMSLGPCLDSRVTGQDCLYIGDIGDNQRRRSAYTIYVVAEPTSVSVSALDRNVPSLDAQKVVYVYPDTRYDSEALAVLPSGDIVVVTKGRTGQINVFTIESDDVRQSAERGDTVTATFVATLPIDPSWVTGRLVTGAARSPSGSVLVIRTYFELFFFTYNGGTFTQRGVSCFLGNMDPQGEAVDFLDEETLVLTSESTQAERGQIHLVRCR